MSKKSEEARVLARTPRVLVLVFTLAALVYAIAIGAWNWAAEKLGWRN